MNLLPKKDTTKIPEREICQVLSEGGMMRNMISYIRGVILEVFETALLVEAQQVGYSVCIPSRQLRAFHEGDTVALYIHPQLDMREGRISYYGFTEKQELDFFHRLTSVSGVGPRAAMNILSTASVDECARAIETEQSEIFERSPGIGKKTAQKIILELKGKIDFRQQRSGDDVVSALVGLGYTREQARAAAQSLSPELPLAERIREALRSLDVSKKQGRGL